MELGSDVFLGIMQAHEDPHDKIHNINSFTLFQQLAVVMCQEM